MFQGFKYPFQINPASGRAAVERDYERHVKSLILQVLLLLSQRVLLGLKPFKWLTEAVNHPSPYGTISLCLLRQQARTLGNLDDKQLSRNICK